MARQSLLSPAVGLKPKAEESPRPVTSPVAPSAPVKRVNPNSGKYHLGGYYDPADPTIEAFRILATKTRRSQQELLLEAAADLVAKYEAQNAFKR